MRGPVTTDDLRINLNHGGECELVYLNGRLNIDSSPILRRQLMAMLRVPAPKPMMIDLTDVAYIDISGLATLVEALKMARKRQTSLSLKGLQGRPLHLFEVTGVLGLFQSNGCESAQSALKVP